MSAYQATKYTVEAYFFQTHRNLYSPNISLEPTYYVRTSIQICPVLLRIPYHNRLRNMRVVKQSILITMPQTVPKARLTIDIFLQGI